MRLLLSIAALVAAASAQSLDTLGKEFIFGLPYPLPPEAPPHVYITSEVATTGKVEIPGLAFSQNFSVVPNVTTEVVLPLASYNNVNDEITSKGVRITAANEVSALLVLGRLFDSDSVRLHPVDTLGRQYLTFSWTGGLSAASFTVIATQDDTTVDITPAATSVANLRPAGMPFSVHLNRLQVYELIFPGTNDHTGSIIQSNKPVAVVSGHVGAQIPYGVDYADAVFEQLPATTAWGTQFLAAPYSGRQLDSVIRVLARDNGTEVRWNGNLLATLPARGFYDFYFGSPGTLDTSKPALVGMFSQGAKAGDDTGDPALTWIPPVQQYLKSHRFHVADDYFGLPFEDTRVAAVMRSAETGSCLFDGAPFPGPFTAVGTSVYSTTNLSANPGLHTVACPSGVDVQVYGWLDADAYASPAGFRMTHISAPRCDVNGDAKIDTADIALIATARNSPAAEPTDPRDADGDMTITVADVRACTLKCTKPACQP